MRATWGLTQSGRVSLGLAVLLYLSSLTSLSSLLLLIDGLLLGVVCVNAVMARRALDVMEVIVPRRIRAVEGRRPTNPWVVRNKGKRWTGLVEISTGGGIAVRVGALEPGSEASVLPEGQIMRRGAHDLAGTRIGTCWPFGLVTCTRNAGLSGSLLVVPDVYQAEAPAARGFDVMLGGRYRGARRTGSGTNVSGIRAFQDGDPLRLVHWKASARGRGWMVKTFEEELSGRVAILLDGGDGGEAGVRDDAVRAAGSLIFAALDAGHHVEWRDLSEPMGLLYPPFSDGEAILDHLAGLGSAPGCVTRGVLEDAVAGFSKRSAVSMVATRLTSVLEDAMRGWVEGGRTVSLYLPSGAPQEGLPCGVMLFRYGRDSISVASPE